MAFDYESLDARQKKIGYFLHRYCNHFHIEEYFKNRLREVILKLSEYYGYDTRIYVNSETNLFTSWCIKPNDDGYKIEDFIMNKLFFNLQEITSFKKTDNPDVQVQKWGYDHDERQIIFDYEGTVIHARTVGDYIYNHYPISLPYEETVKRAKDAYNSTLSYIFYKEALQAIQTNFVNGKMYNQDPITGDYLNFFDRFLDSAAYYPDSPYQELINAVSFEEDPSEEYKPFKAKPSERIFNLFLSEILKEAELIMVRQPPLQYQQNLYQESDEPGRVYRNIYNLDNPNKHLAAYGVIMSCILGRERVFNLLYLNDSLPIKNLNNMLFRLFEEKFKEVKRPIGDIETLHGAMGAIEIVCKKAATIYEQPNELPRKKLVDEELDLNRKLLIIYQLRLELEYGNRERTEAVVKRISSEIAFLRNAVISSDTVDNLDFLDQLEAEYCKKYVK